MGSQSSRDGEFLPISTYNVILNDKVLKYKQKINVKDLNMQTLAIITSLYKMQFV